MDVCEVFGELPEELFAQRKYAKWKATYIHNCLKNGETPVPGPPGGFTDEENPSIEVPHAPSEEAASAFPSVPQPQAAAVITPTPPPAAISTPQPPSGSVALTQEQFVKAQKYCKYASSSLDYEDTPTAIDFLNKALRLLQTGQDS